MSVIIEYILGLWTSHTYDIVYYPHICVVPAQSPRLSHSLEDFAALIPHENPHQLPVMEVCWFVCLSISQSVCLSFGMFCVLLLKISLKSTSINQYYNLIPQIISRIFDGSEFQSFKECYGTRLVTGFARLLG